MRTFAKKVLILAAMTAGTMMVSNAQVVYWNGLGRALVTGSYLGGNILNEDLGATPPQQKDLKSARKSTDGYTIFDLGVNAQPNETLRASATLRLKNSFGGFYGDGSQFLFRQLKLDGIISKRVKYEIGDIDLELSKYTLHNFSEIYNDYESDILAQRRSVVEYENFNFGNKWRLQGAHLETSLRFNQGIEKLGLRFFATRNRRYVPSSVPDRFMVGGRAEIFQSRMLQIGGNYIYIFDAAGTVSSPLSTNQNQVVTGDLKFTHFTDKVDYSVYGEAGASTNKYSYKEADTVSTNGNFYDVGVSAKYKPLLLKLYVNYRNVSENFFSSGAQTRRINDYGTVDLFSQLQNAPGVDPLNSRSSAAMGGATLMDYVTDQDLRNLNLKNSLMQYNPAYNNITPYGQATPNRKGLTIGGSIGNNEKVVKADFAVDLMSQAVADTAGASARKYTGIKGGARFNAHKVLRFEKDIILTAGIRNENTQRTGVSPVDLKSTLIDLGLTVEVVKNLDILGGAKMINAKGHESIFLRDEYNRIDTTKSFYNVDLSQSQTLLSAGARYRFSKNTYFTVNWVNQAVKFKEASMRNYHINQIFFNYTMIF
ncbi:MAG: CHU_1277 family cellulose-binding protein [Cytophaga sp.]|uniref:CHU_1277 family cellulose-binding protein n=1 Tax=Cytophaga sp. TaxID=29535 RepID=UPI003F7F7B84